METAPLYEDVADAPEGGRAFYVRTADGTRIRFALWGGGTKGLAVVLPGRTECLEKYGRMASMLLARGLAVAIIDWRGQGLSDRLNNSTAVGHVDDFTDYQDDLQTVLSHPEVQAITGPRIMFAHSMGGCIGLRALLTDNAFKAAVFSAPMWGLNLPGPNKFLAPLLANVGVALGFGKKTLAGQPKGFYLTREPFEGNNLTHDQNFWDYMREQITKYPALALGTPSFKWLKGALGEFKYFDTAAMPTIPCLMFVGSDESVVSPAAIRKHSPQFANGTLVEIDGARHEVWMETPERQAQSWAAIDSFLDTTL
ncbi:MAG TPA: alpha/beta hydrolase [Rhodobacteraceae bacterium]|nr:alpha/beta hydrolase [Paracoccaceae bacterium]